MASETDSRADPSRTRVVHPLPWCVPLLRNLPFTVVSSGRHRDCHSFAHAFRASATDRSFTERLPARMLSLSDIGCKIPQPIFEAEGGQNENGQKGVSIDGCPLRRIARAVCGCRGDDLIQRLQRLSNHRAGQRHVDGSKQSRVRCHADIYREGDRVHR